MIYESKEEAAIANDGAKTALEIVEMLEASHGYRLHPTNAGQSAVKLKSKYVAYKPFNQQGKAGKMYLAYSIPDIIEMLVKLAKRRESYGQNVR